MSTLTDIGEFGLIDLIKKKFTPYGPETVVGIDDDCAVVKMCIRDRPKFPNIS